MLYFYNIYGSAGRIRTDGVADLQSTALGHSATALYYGTPGVLGDARPAVGAFPWRSACSSSEYSKAYVVICFRIPCADTGYDRVDALPRSLLFHIWNSMCPVRPFSLFSVLPGPRFPFHITKNPRVFSPRVLEVCCELVCYTTISRTLDFSEPRSLLLNIGAQIVDQ